MNTIIGVDRAENGQFCRSMVERWGPLDQVPQALPLVGVALLDAEQRRERKPVLERPVGLLPGAQALLPAPGAHDLRAMLPRAAHAPCKEGGRTSGRTASR